MKALCCVLMTIALVGCGEYGDELDARIIEQHIADCAARGYSQVKIIFLFGRPSSYYTCLK